MNEIKASVIIVSYNTRHLLRRCIDSVASSAGMMPHEIIIVDNDSSDGSAEFIESEYPGILLIKCKENIGFGGANNLGFQKARGEYIVLLNSDAFLIGPSMQLSVAMMDERPDVGLAGARLTGENGEWQPSARSFPGLWNDFLTYTALPRRWPKSRLFGRPDMTWRDQDQEILCDWVPGAFSIIRRKILEKIGLFDPRFFLYFEEVDLCRRIRHEGWRVAYWPNLVVVHIGGASATSLSSGVISKNGRQMSLWRLQSQYLYYRKQRGWLIARLSRRQESIFFSLIAWRNRNRDSGKREESRVMLELIDRAWENTKGGRCSPPIPWKGV